MPLLDLPSNDALARSGLDRGPSMGAAPGSPPPDRMAAPPPPTPPEWRGTFVQALLESERTAPGSAYVSASWDKQAIVRVESAPRLLGIAAMVTPDGRAVYAVRPDGTIHNTVTGRDEYLRLRPDGSYPTRLREALDRHLASTAGHPPPPARTEGGPRREEDVERIAPEDRMHVQAEHGGGREYARKSGADHGTWRLEKGQPGGGRFTTGPGRTPYAPPVAGTGVETEAAVTLWSHFPKALQDQQTLHVYGGKDDGVLRSGYQVGTEGTLDKDGFHATGRAMWDTEMQWIGRSKPFAVDQLGLKGQATGQLRSHIGGNLDGGVDIGKKGVRASAGGKVEAVLFQAHGEASATVPVVCVDITGRVEGDANAVAIGAQARGQVSLTPSKIGVSGRAGVSALFGLAGGAGVDIDVQRCLKWFAHPTLEPPPSATTMLQDGTTTGFRVPAATQLLLRSPMDWNARVLRPGP